MRTLFAHNPLCLRCRRLGRRVCPPFTERDFDTTTPVLPQILCAVAGLITGTVVTHVVGHRIWTAATAVAKSEWHERVAQLLAELAAARGERTTVADERARLAAQLEIHEGQGSDRASAVDALVAQVGEQLSNTSTENMRIGLKWAAGVARAHLDRLQDAFSKENADRDRAVEQMVRPVRDGLELLRALTDRVERDRANALGTLQEQLRHLAAGHQRLSDETSALTRALRTPQVRGRWGEMALERLVEASGMLRNVDWVAQPTLTNEDGSARPDMIITLPGNGRKVVVDSKVPLESFLKATDASTEAERARWMDAHAAQVRKHVDSLAKKQYGEKSVDACPVVFLFMPAESLYAEAVARDAALVSYALDRQIMLVSPATLMLALRIVAFAWQQDRLSETVLEVRDLGAQLYARIGTLVEHFEKLRRSIRATVNAFNNVSGALESRVMPTSRTLHRVNNLEGEVLAPLQLVDDIPRALGAPEFTLLLAPTTTEESALASQAPVDLVA